MVAPLGRPPEPNPVSGENSACSRLRMRFSPEAVIVVTAGNRIVLVDSPSWSMDEFNQREIVEILVPEGFSDPARTSGQPAQFPVELIVGQSAEGVKTETHRGTAAGDSPSREIAFGSSLVKHSIDAIVVQDRDGRILTWNETAEKVYCYPPDEILGKPFSLLLPPEIRAAEKRQRDKIIEGGHVPSFDTTRTTKDGRTIPVSVSISPVKDASGSIVAILEIARDVSSRQAEERALAGQVALLSQSNRELQDYAAMVSHDLQAPLNLVAGYFAQLAAQTGAAPDPKQKELLDSASAAIVRMQKLIKDLLELARLEGRAPALARTDCAAVIAQALANLELIIKESGAAVEVGTMPVVRADSTQLMQVFQNLISNAIKFKGDRVPKVRVIAELRAGEWLFSVSDNGIGIDPALIPRLFQPLQRLQPHAAPSGSGLGLAIARRIMTRHGGRIWAEAKPGMGSTFYFTLPAAESEGMENRSRSG